MLLIPQMAMTFVHELPGEWNIIPDFRLPVRPENSSAISILSKEIAKRLTELKGNSNFDFQFGKEGQLEAREKDSRERITRISLSVRRVHDAIRQVLQEVAPELPPPRRYELAPHSTEALPGAPHDASCASETMTLRFTTILKRWFRDRKSQPPSSDSQVVRQELRDRLFQFLYRADELSQLQELTRWLEELQNDGQLPTLIDSASKRRAQRNDGQNESR